MHCPKCSHTDTKVIDSRAIENWSWIRRRRQCEVCWFRFTTFERSWLTEIMVIKRDWTKEIYNKSKLKKAIMLSFAKRNVSPEQIDNMIADLEANRTKHWTEIDTHRIWEDVLDKLKELDPVAYVRFASVYMKFDNFDDFF